MINFLKFKNIYYLFSFLLVGGSIIGLIIFGLNWGIDFQGGGALTFQYLDGQPTAEAVREALSETVSGAVNVRLIGEKEMTVQINSRNVSQEDKTEIIGALEELGEIDKASINFESISPIIGRELNQKTRTVVILSTIIILLYISFAFRKIAHPLPSWQYGFAALIALLHDVLITLGVFVVIGELYGIQINISIITALLVVFGYSVNDSVVVFDRIRENLLKGIGKDYFDTVNISLNQTLKRSLNTSLTTLLALLSIFFFGGTALHFFALALIIGIISGTYSSFFLASPLLASCYLLKKRK